MHLPSYEIIEITDDFSEHKFISSGPHGDTVKLLVFKRVFVDTLYNLALLDVMSNGALSDTHFSNNNDLRKILATVVEVIINYTKKFPERNVFFQGSDGGRRISLYHNAISKYLFILEKEFVIYGVTDLGIEETFNPSNKYSAILVKRK